mgnify:CR=1 FL=1|tara:strand:+ start:358 stop:567 length:210 start_codon:yes stop_codon:yes gene_type:complete
MMEDQIVIYKSGDKPSRPWTGDLHLNGKILRGYWHFYPSLRALKESVNTFADQAYTTGVSIRRMTVRRL